MADKESSWQGTILSLYGQRSWLRKSLKICQKLKFVNFIKYRFLCINFEAHTLKIGVRNCQIKRETVKFLTIGKK